MKCPSECGLVASAVSLTMIAVACSSRPVADSIPQRPDEPLIQVRVAYDELAPEREQVDAAAGRPPTLVVFDGRSEWAVT
ncbi:MAG: hypothetical protein GEU90_13585 [Gemmatimonas sp.]|nr:hypothetical protein [Gemmatimonas sp.]